MLFDFFSSLTHPSKKPGWEETTAVFTGAVRKAQIIRRRPDYFYKERIADYNEYEIKYYVDDKERTGWYCVYPLPDPDSADFAGTKLRIRYKKKRPWIFEEIPDLE